MNTEPSKHNAVVAEADRTVPDGDRIRQQLQRILESPEFPATEQQRRFLQFVVHETLEGKAGEIKAYTVATRVFGRTTDFDQAVDPIVSIQANKLRRALERYYLVAGQQDPIRIDIPKGTYVPTFLEQPGAFPTAAVTKMADGWPAVLIRPFQNLTGDDHLNFLALGLSSELVAELSRYQDIRVLMETPAGYGRRIADTAARFVLEGTVRADDTGIKVVVHLSDAQTGVLAWSDSHQCSLEAARLIAFQEKIAQMVAVKVGGERGAIFRTLSQEARNQPPARFKTYEAILRYYDYELTLTPESFAQAMAALTHAASIEPDCGNVWSMLGRIYANGFSLEMPGFENGLHTAAEFAERGIQLNPDCQRNRGVLALVRFFANELPAARSELDKALALNPNSLFILDGIAYLMTLMGDWEQGPKLIRHTMDANPYYGTYVHYALWVDWLRQGEYERAYLECLNFKRPAVFWEPLMKAATLGLLGRVDEGRVKAARLLQFKPDFKTRGRTLIGHYIKFEDIAQLTIEGLRKVAVAVD